MVKYVRDWELWLLKGAIQTGTASCARHRCRFFLERSKYP